MGDILFVRHGRTSWNDEGRIQGRASIPLTDAGRAQIARLVPWMAHWGPDALYASPVQRALESAQLIAGAIGVPLVVDDGFAELDVGEWLGKTGAELDVSSASWRAYQTSPPLSHPVGGESFRQLVGRVRRAVDRLRSKNHTRAIVVAHADVIRVSLCLLLQLPVERLRAFGVGIGTVSLVEDAFDVSRLVVHGWPPEAFEGE